MTTSRDSTVLAAPTSLTAVAKPGCDRERAVALVEESYTTIYRALYRMCGDSDVAADLTQETYRRAWAAIGTFQGRSSFTTWLYRIATTTFLNHRRRAPRSLPLDDDASEPATPPPPPSQDDAEVLRRAVLALPAELSFAVMAHYWADRPVSDIAREVGISTVAIRKRLKKAMRMLHASLGASR